MAEFDEETRNMIWAAAHTTPAVDVRVFTAPRDPAAPGVTGIDALLTTPDILAEFFRRRAHNQRAVSADPSAGAAHEAYIKTLTPGELADIVWRQLFIDHPPLSEPVRIVLTTLGLFGIDVSHGELRLLREQFSLVPPEQRQERALALANLDLVLYPVECLDAAGAVPPPRHAAFRPVLHLSTLLGDWKESARRLRLDGFGLKAKVDEFTPLELRRYLAAEIARVSPVALSLDWPDGCLPADGSVGRLVREAVVPVCRERNLALMLAGGNARIADLACLWEDNPENRFLLFPGREDQFNASVMAAAGRGNLLLCGPDQPLSYPLALEPFTGTRLEALGSAFHACHSGADTAEELAGCWAHMRWTLGKALIRRYADLWRTGWRYCEADVQKDVRAMLGGNARIFLGI